ncbi:MAG: type II toxin-antitoxin system HicB family antitoxin [Candidatus Acidiferrales bacterium]
MKKYLIVVEATSSGYSTYAPDLDGCVASGSTREEVESNMRGAIAFHLEGLHRDGYEVPEPHTYPAFIELQS